MDARNARRLCYLLFPAYYLTTFLTMNPPEWPAEPAAPMTGSKWVDNHNDDKEVEEVNVVDEEADAEKTKTETLGRDLS